MTESQQAYLDYIQSNPGCNAVDLQKLTNAPLAQIYKDIVIILNEGLIMRKTRNRKGAGYMYYPATPVSIEPPERTMHLCREVDSVFYYSRLAR